MSVFLSVSVALFAGLIITRIFKVLGMNFPDVTAFLIAGILVGPSCLGRLGIEGVGFVSYHAVEEISVISTAALGFIAFSIGSEFKLSALRKTGKAAAVIGIVQAVNATILVDAALIALHFVLGDDILPIEAAITLGAIASATAPAATLMVVRQYKADGPLTRLLLPIVALDDAVGLVVFSVSFGIAMAMHGGNLDLISIVVDPFLEIVFSVLLGSVLGYILSRLEKLFYSNTNRLNMTITFVFLTVALSYLEVPVGKAKISFSSLLVCMMLGTVFCNISEVADDIMNRADKWTAPLYVAFFVLSGAELELGVFRRREYVLIGIVFILIRSAGKYLGAYVSSGVMNCEQNVRKYLGITLLPQAGVALGMCSQAMALGEDIGSVIRNVTLFGVMIYELAGPFMTKEALTKAGEISTKPAGKQSRARFRKA